MQFSLDTHLERDGIRVAESEHYLLNLANDCRFPWLVLIPKVENARDTFDLSEAQQIDVSLLSNRIGQLMMDAFDGDKFNIASLGNMVPQLHIHLIVRHQGDAAWPGPVWGVGDAEPYGEPQLKSALKQLEEVIKLVNTD